MKSTARLAFLLTAAAPLAAEGAMDFKRDIQPILEQKCYSCHSEKAKKKKGGYTFDSIASIKSEIGFLIKPGDPSGSDLMLKVTRQQENFMPPDAKDALSAAEIKKLSTWIQEGAVLEKGAVASTSGLPAKTGEPNFTQPLDWTNTDGKTIKATFVKMTNGDKVILRLSGGRNYEMPLKKLSDSSQAQALKAAGASIR